MNDDPRDDESQPAHGDESQLTETHRKTPLQIDHPRSPDIGTHIDDYA